MAQINVQKLLKNALLRTEAVDEEMKQAELQNKEDEVIANALEDVPDPEEQEVAKAQEEAKEKAGMSKEDPPSIPAVAETVETVTEAKDDKDEPLKKADKKKDKEDDDDVPDEEEISDEDKEMMKALDDVDDDEDEEDETNESESAITHGKILDNGADLEVSDADFEQTKEVPENADFGNDIMAETVMFGIAAKKYLSVRQSKVLEEGVVDSAVNAIKRVKAEMGNVKDQMAKASGAAVDSLKKHYSTLKVEYDKLVADHPQAAKVAMGVAAGAVVAGAGAAVAKKVLKKK